MHSAPKNAKITASVSDTAQSADQHKERSIAPTALCSSILSALHARFEDREAALYCSVTGHAIERAS